MTTNQSLITNHGAVWVVDDGVQIPDGNVVDLLVLEGVYRSEKMGPLLVRQHPQLPAKCLLLLLLLLR